MPFFGKKPSFLVVAQDELDQRLRKKNILIVGGTAGIGKSLAKSCLARGASVTVVGRRKPDESLNAATWKQKDLQLMRDATSLAKELDTSSFDIIVFTNGIIAAPQRQETKEGIELDLAVSYLSRFSFSEALFKKRDFGFKRLDQSVKPRVFVMGFPGVPNKATLDDFNSEKEYKVFPAHMNTVVGNEALVRHWAESVPEVNVYGLNPGLIYTEIRDNYLQKGSFLSNVVETLIKWTQQSADQYAENVLTPLMVSPELETMSKSHFNSDGSLMTSNPFLLEAGNHEKLIQKSKELLQSALNKLI